MSLSPAWSLGTLVSRDNQHRSRYLHPDLLPGANVMITGTSPQTVNYGADGIPVTAVPDAGYHFVTGVTPAPGTPGPMRT